MDWQSLSNRTMASPIGVAVATGVGVVAFARNALLRRRSASAVMPPVAIGTSHATTLLHANHGTNVAPPAPAVQAPPVAAAPLAVSVAGSSITGSAGAPAVGAQLVVPPVPAVAVPAVAAPAVVPPVAPPAAAAPVVVVVPPAAPGAGPVIVDYASAVAGRADMIMAVANRALDEGPLVPLRLGVQPRLRSLVGRDWSNMPDGRLIGELERMWRISRNIGSHVGAGDGFVLGGVRGKVHARMVRVCKVFAPTASFWAGRPPYRSYVDDAYVRRTVVSILPRQNANSAKVTDTYMVSGNIKGDTRWAFDLLCIVELLCTRRGASVVQGRYIAAAMLIQVLSVMAGANPGLAGLNLAPENFGFVVPATLPTVW